MLVFPQISVWSVDQKSGHDPALKYCQFRLDDAGAFAQRCLF